jgi:hypothetical protein
VPIPPVAAAAVAAPRPMPTAGGARFEASLAVHATLEPPRPGVQLARALHSLEASQARLDRVLQAARGGRSFTAGELLALQADAYRFTQAIDVAAKLVEHGVQSVKQAVNAQV